ncbi:thiol reductant ABC exporter subunit CydC [Glutamicibacter halophytocola]|uniref:Thiol reductant ABC exporter subunit CydC n=1 Tax=Glutamicibacter halophytocola TaxID=1933880 RepID=A0AA95BPZ3_9MICC|nr:thiol reductant ABC exporter subunit CydC [Glutamicibacter halophytocola]UUX57719.1 thiol reductant ABC exporter subunit CydC [Glutamicibacter halophytocola]
MPAPRFLPKELISPRQFAVLTCFSVFKVLGLVLVAYSLGTWIATMASGAKSDPQLLLVAGAGAILRALAAWGLNAGARRMGMGAKERMRMQLLSSESSHPVIVPATQNSIPVVATLASHGIEKLDDYFTKFIPALIGAAAVPLLLGIYILRLDWISAVILLLTVPLIPVFMALIGMHTQDTLKESQSSLDRLASQLYELAQGLPALLGLGRARQQGNAIAQVGENYRIATMANLRTVFMSSFWLELISTLSVAVLAVFIGVRLVNGSMELSAGLTILILAPELFSALREVGSAYHAADDGLAAYQRYQNMTAAAPSTATIGASPARASKVLEIENLSVRYEGNEPICKNLNLSLGAGERKIIATSSGTGKTTLITLIAEASCSDNAFDPELVQGTIRTSGSIALINQHPRFDAETGEEQLAQDIHASRPGLVSELAERLSMDHMLGRKIAEYSPGELRRLEVLRAVARLHSDPQCTLLLADEPTAHLDDDNASVVRQLLSEIPARCAVLIASHDPLIDNSQGRGASITPKPAWPGQESEHRASGIQDAVPSTALDQSRQRFNPRRELLRGYRSAPKAVAWGTISVLCAVALAALSGWLIVEASYQPPILHLSVAFVMVRALGIGRAAFRYLEQLAIHDAVLEYAGKLREKIWNAMVADPARWGLFSRSSVVLRFFLAEVDELRDQLARVVFPPLSAITLWGVATVALFLIQPEFGWTAVIAGILLAFPVRWLVQRIEGQHLVRQMTHRMAMNQSILGILRHKSALRINGSLNAALASVNSAEQENTKDAQRHALGQGSAPALAVLLSVLMAIVVAAVSQSSASLTALAVLLSLALGDSATSALLAVQQGQALKQLAGLLGQHGLSNQNQQGRENDHAASFTPEVAGFELDEVSLGYGHGPNVVDKLTATIPQRRWTAIVGPSGSGKSTLMTALLGALSVRAGTLSLIDEHGMRSPIHGAKLNSVAWCPQEAHLFDSSIRRNLMLGVADGEQREDAQLVEVLQHVGLHSWYQQQAEGLETRIGSGGHHLSGGQRCKMAVARALLGGHQVVLLDEPTAHLGADEAAELMDTLRRALQDRTVVLITHDERLAEQCHERIQLEAKVAA